MLSSVLSTLAVAGLAAAAPITHTFSKRFTGEATYYATGLGACGGTNSDSDFIVALNAPQYGDGYPGPQCGKSVTISYKGKTTSATVVDKCPGCAYGDLDMSPSLFAFFEDHGVGRFEMSWEFGSGGGAPAPAPEPETTQEEKPVETSTTPEPTPEPTPTPSPEAPPPAAVSVEATPSNTPSSAAPSSSTESTAASSTSALPSSTPPVSSSSANISSTTNSTTNSITNSTTNSTAPTTVPVVANPDVQVDADAGNLANLNNLLSQLGRLVIAGAGAA